MVQVTDGVLRPGADGGDGLLQGISSRRPCTAWRHTQAVGARMTRQAICRRPLQRAATYGNNSLTLRCATSQ